MGRVKRSDFNEPPPETDQSLHCSDADWRNFIVNEEDKLHRQSVHGASDRQTVVRSGIKGLTMAVTIPSKLPIIDMKEKILDLVVGNRIVVLSGPTGCAKSTQVPQYILDKHAMGKKAVNIIVTQPRKIAASGVARRIKSTQVPKYILDKHAMDKKAVNISHPT